MVNWFIMSHRRSGAHYLIKLLELNYGIKSTVRHLPPNEFKGKNKPKDQFICLVRDPRDVLVACYFYYKNLQYFDLQYLERFGDITIQDFIRGFDIKINEIKGKKFHKQHWTEKMFLDPIKYWVYFIQGWMNEGVIIKYESIFKGLEEHFGEKKKFIDHETLCAPYARNKKIGEYKEFLTDDDNELFIQKAGDLMIELGYDLKN